MATPVTVPPRPPRRRLVRRGALEKAWATVLADLHPALHEPLMAWVDARKAEYETRSALSTAMTATGTRWFEVEKIARELADAGS